MSELPFFLEYSAVFFVIKSEYRGFYVYNWFLHVPYELIYHKKGLFQKSR